MTTFTQLTPAPSDPPEPFTDRLRLAVAAYLARFKGSSREHTESDLRCYLAWCAERGLDPLAARRPHLELYIRCLCAGLDIIKDCCNPSSSAFPSDYGGDARSSPRILP